MTVTHVLATVSGSVVSVGIIYRGVVRPVFKWAQRLERTMTFVEAQVQPNGGSSMRDAVNRIEERLTFVEAYITTPN